MRHPVPNRANDGLRHLSVTLACLVLVGTAAACTGEDEGPQSEPSPAASPDATTTLEVKPAPAKVRVTRVQGRLRPKSRDVLADNIGKVVTGYFDDAFLGGDYPRSGFGDAFRRFSAGAANQAGQDRDLLTNRVLGPTTEQVTPRRQTAYLSVLAPFKVAAGVTAKVELDYLAQRGEKPDKRVVVKGRLMLTRKKTGGWKIFGYDLSRSARTVGEAS